MNNDDWMDDVDPSQPYGINYWIRKSENDPTDAFDNLVRREMPQIPVSSCDAGVSKLVTDDTDIQSVGCQHASTNMPHLVGMHSPVDPCFLRVPGQQPADVGIVEAMAFMRTEQIRAVGSNIDPRLDVLLEEFFVHTNHPTFASLTAKNCNCHVFLPRYITRAEIERLVAAELGIQ